MARPPYFDFAFGHFEVLFALVPRMVLREMPNTLDGALPQRWFNLVVQNPFSYL